MVVETTPSGCHPFGLLVVERMWNAADERLRVFLVLLKAGVEVTADYVVKGHPVRYDIVWIQEGDVVTYFSVSNLPDIANPVCSSFAKKGFVDLVDTVG